MKEHGASGAGVEQTTMGIFSDLNKRITENIYAHGNYFTNPDADHQEKLEEAIELLMPFIRPDARDIVRSQVLGLIHEYRHEDLRLKEKA
jgi:hypothetical protein